MLRLKLKPKRLEVKPQSELHNSRIALQSCDRTEAAPVDGAIWQTEIGLIQRVENLPPKFKICIFVP
jgi:hypothetical protein